MHPVRLLHLPTSPAYSFEVWGEGEVESRPVKTISTLSLYNEVLLFLSSLSRYFSVYLTKCYSPISPTTPGVEG